MGKVGISIPQHTIRHRLPPGVQRRDDVLPRQKPVVVVADDADSVPGAFPIIVKRPASYIAVRAGDGSVRLNDSAFAAPRTHQRQPLQHHQIKRTEVLRNRLVTQTKFAAVLKICPPPDPVFCTSAHRQASEPVPARICSTSHPRRRSSRSTGHTESQDRPTPATCSPAPARHSFCRLHSPSYFGTP